MVYVTRGPIVAAGILLGVGLGGMLDGIVFHQILQWHNMLSAVAPVTDLDAARYNMLWDGVFHAGVWLVTLIGVAVLWRAYFHPRAPGDGQALAGWMLFGWGLFNAVEGAVNHLVLGIHHVREDVPDPQLWDLGFIALGVVLMLVGVGYVWAGRTIARRSGWTTRHPDPV